MIQPQPNEYYCDRLKKETMKLSALFGPLLSLQVLISPAIMEAQNENKKLSSTAMNNVHIFSENFHIPQLDRFRRIWVYVPPDYETSGKHYPVLYLHDGQNLFDDETSFVGEWKVDEVLNEMFLDDFSGPIVVGIEHGSEERLNEYSPWKRESLGGGLGDQHVDFIVQTLKPAIDKNYRTITGREHTGIGGSSMGGLISFYATLKYPEVFSRSMVFSPAFWFSEKSYEYAWNFLVKEDFRFYFLAGGKEYGERNVITTTRKMIDIMVSNGLWENQYKFVADPKGIHNEAFWNEYFEDAVRFLFEADFR